MSEYEFDDVTAEERMRLAGRLFIITGIVTLFLSLIGLFTFLPLLTLISKISLLITIIVLGFALYNLTLKYSIITQDAKRARLLLLLYAVLELLTSIFVLISVQVLVAITGFVALLLRLVSFTYLDKTFRRLDDNLGSSIYIAYAWYGVFVVLTLIISVFSLNLSAIIATGIISIVGEIALIIGVGIKTHTNANDLTYIDPVEISNRFPADEMYCTVCGHLILETDMNFCPKCGESLKT